MGFGVVDRRYQLISTLGRGGMGVVYLARDRLGSQVALKRLASAIQGLPKTSPTAVLKNPQSDQMNPTNDQNGGLGGIDSTMQAPLNEVTVVADLTEVPPSIAFGFDGTGMATEDADAPVAHDSDAQATHTMPRTRVGDRRAKPQPGPRSPERMIVLSTPDVGKLVRDVPRLTLAREFQLLAGLRHPNVVSVLDYGFDDKLHPYFTMELLRNARSILSVGLGRSTAGKLDLLGQMLRALVYLHRRGVIHRDLKPANVMVVADQVKVLDFGVSTLPGYDNAGRLVVAGTLPYMAPEVVQFQPPNITSDLYAVGIIAYELFTGRYPFPTPDAMQLRKDIMETEPDLSGVEAGIAPVLKRLLAKDPEERYQSGIEVLAALNQATGAELAIETKDTRESFLQAAELVGRDAELRYLLSMLDQTRRGQGGSVLVGGESGVGKSRLFEELRVRALVEGAVVLRGQAVSEGRKPYHVWRDVLRWMALDELSDFEAGVLKAIVPEVESILDRPVPEVPSLAPDAAQNRLVTVMEKLLHRQQRIVLLVLEDLQWAGSDSLKLLSRIARLAEEVSLLVVANYRDDEAPDLPEELPMMRVLELRRLTRNGIAALSESMLGATGRQQNIVGFLDRETEGNPFFVVEVVRALAEEAGALSSVGTAPLPESVLAGGIHRIIEHRLDQVPPAARPLIQLAAVLGRYVDTALLGHLSPDVDLQAWIAACADVAVLDLSEGSWRFAHDKLREGLLAELDLAQRRVLNQRAAESIEAVYPNAPEQGARLAFHWGLAGNRIKEIHYRGVAGEVALNNGAYREATEMFQRALEQLAEESDLALAASLPDTSGAHVLPSHWRAPVVQRWHQLREYLCLDTWIEADSDRFRCGRLEGLLAIAYHEQGDMANSMRHGKRALRYLGRPMPRSTGGLLATLPREIGLRFLQRALPEMFQVRHPDRRQILLEAALVQTRMTSAHIFSEDALPSLWSGLRVLSLAEPAGPSPALIQGYSLMGMVLGPLRLRKLAATWEDRALQLSQRVDDDVSRLLALIQSSVYSIQVADWSCFERLEQALELADRIGATRQWEEAVGVSAQAHCYTGQFERAVELAVQLERSARQSGHVQPRWWGTIMQAQNLIRMGHASETLDALKETKAEIDDHGLTADVIWMQGLYALALLRSGKPVRAHEEARAGLALLQAHRPVAFWNQQSATAIAEVVLSLWADSKRGGRVGDRDLAAAARAACKCMHGYAQAFPFARPYALLWQGRYDWLSGRPEQAHQVWAQCIEVARSLGMPYELGRAYLELGTCIDTVARSWRCEHLEAAGAIFQRLGAADDRARAREELARLAQRRA